MVDWLESTPFEALTSVRGNVTLESFELLRNELRNYAATFTNQGVELTKSRSLRVIYAPSSRPAPYWGRCET